MAEHKEIACEMQQKLAEEVQRHLSVLVDLAHAEREAVRTGDDALIMMIDKQIEAAIGDKERAMGALRHHRAEHGC